MRRGLAAGLAITAPAAIWALPQLAAPTDEAVAVWSLALAGLWTAGAVGAALLGPWIAARASLARAGAGMGMLVLTPLPLLSIVWLGGGASAGALGRGALMLAAVAAAGLGVARTWPATEAPGLAGRAQGPGLAHRALPLALAAALWTTRAAWLGWIGA